ncbi:DUF2383 domain-containing protein [Cytobacillus sp. IB215665]|uniref:DUF2383 domain-containing protein n=1 Tax=Cytobacillus sp. IB215665 TaxID=3097357 RepID=UPI002A18338A|nr:DUF2383 domain-containing protein [Cytobacillus sp. IB215665]MDX8365699.1 DUF2383 domain-containing protein [Cytobacillus sp. IB215665]
MENNVVIKELNALLKGRYMGIHAYESYMQNVKDDELKKDLQKIQQNHKEHANLLAERIQNLGGKPADNPGIVGNMKELVSEIKGFPDTKEGIIQGLIDGENTYSIKMSEDIVRGDLDDESLRIVEKIIDEDRSHVQQLKNILH